MKVKELIEQLKQLPQDDDIAITAMNDEFFCSEFEIHSPYDGGQTQEIILPMYIKDYTMEEQKDNRSIPEIMSDLEKTCLDFQAKWQAFETNFKSKYTDSTNQERD